MVRTTFPLSAVTVFWLRPLRWFGDWFLPSGASPMRAISCGLEEQNGVIDGGGVAIASIGIGHNRDRDAARDHPTDPDVIDQSHDTHI